MSATPSSERSRNFEVDTSHDRGKMVFWAKCQRAGYFTGNIFHEAQYFLKIRIVVWKFWNIQTIPMKIRNDFRHDHVLWNHCANTQTSKELMLTTVTVVGLFLNTCLFVEGFTVHLFRVANDFFTYDRSVINLIVSHLQMNIHEYKRLAYSSREAQSPSQSVPIKQSS